MRNYLLSSVAALGIVAACAASAADLPSRKGPVMAPAYAPIFTWTGFYVGVNGGYAFGEVDSTGVSGFRDSDGFVGGGQIGYNYQVGQIVLGLEADFQGADLKSGVSNVLGDTATTEVNYFGTVRARVGFAVDRFMPYVTGGFAYGNVKTAFNFPRIPATFRSDEVQFGYTIGAGLEYAFTNNLSAKIEYLYTDLESGSVSGLPGVKVGTDFSLVRAGLNYRF